MIGLCPASSVPRASSAVALNDISSETLKPILIKLHINNPWMILYHCSNEIDPWGILVDMATKNKNFKNLLKNYLTDLTI